MRAPLKELIRRSPFEGLLHHGEKVLEGIRLLKDVLSLYDKGEVEKAEPLIEKIYEIEREADYIKGNIRNHLHKYIWLPVDKGDLLTCLKELDAVIDCAQDICVWLTLCEEKIPKLIQDKLFELLERDIETVELTIKALKLGIEYLRHPFLKRKLRKEVKEILKEVHDKEDETDLIEREIGKTIFKAKLDPRATFVFLHLNVLLGRIADHAANAGDQIRVMIAR